MMILFLGAGYSITFYIYNYPLVLNLRFLRAGRLVPFQREFRLPRIGPCLQRNVNGYGMDSYYGENHQHLL